MTIATAQHRSGPDSSDLHLTIVDAIDQVDPASWDAVASQQTLFLQRRYLRCMESEPGSSSLRHRYALISGAEGPIGVACFQITDFVGKPAEGWLARKTPVSSRLAKQLGLTDPSLSVRVIVCGSAFTTGEHGFAFAPTVDQTRAVQALATAVRQVEREQVAGDGYSAVLIKEFFPGSTTEAERLKDHSFSEIATAPNMVLLVDPEWGSFDGYLASLSSKFRVKAKRAYAKSEALVVRDLSEDDLRHHHLRIAELYDAVLDRADYRLGKLDPKVLANLRGALAGDYLMKGYFLGDELVGFMSGFVDGDTLEAHVVGVDYELNREHGIYSRMLYDYLRVALERGVSRVNYGRTADEIKSSVGAVPVGMTCYVRHRERTLNKLLPALARYVRLPQAPLREPFKKAWYAINASINRERLGLPGGAAA
jgi:predicted N-acyltransferase